MSRATVAEPPSNANEGPADHPPARQSKPPPDRRAATIKAPTNRLARQSLNDNHASAAMPVSHPDRRCLPIQIAALQRGEKRGGATGGAQVPGVQHLERRERAAHRAKSPRQIQDASPGHDPPNTGDQPTAADRRPDAIPHRMARLLRLLPDPTCAHEPRSVDPPKITLVSLAAMAERA